MNTLTRNSGAASTVIQLLKGRLLAIVDKLRSPESTFEIHTKMAVAAVKGTEFAVDASDDESSLAVNEGLVRYIHSTDRKVSELVGTGNQAKLNAREKRIMLSALGREWQFDRQFGKMREEIRIIRELKKENNDGLIQYRIKKKLSKEGNTAETSETQLTLGGKDLKSTENLKNRVQNHLKYRIRKEFRNAARHSWEDLKYLNEEMKADLHLGKTMTDVKGRRVRIEEYVFRPEPDRVDLLSVTLRENRLDYFRAQNTFNKPLPRFIPKDAWNINWDSMPGLYRLKEEFVISNTVDRVRALTVFGYDTYAGSTIISFDEMAVKPPEFNEPFVDQANGKCTLKPYERVLLINGEVKEHTKFIKDHDTNSGTYGEFVWVKMSDDKTYRTALERLSNERMASGTATLTAIGTGYTDINSEINPGSRDLAITHTSFYNDGSWLKLDLYLINDYGIIQKWPETVTGAISLAQDTNVELILNSSDFVNGDIDVVSKILWYTAFNPNRFR